jgi:hypothetical protein
MVMLMTNACFVSGEVEFVELDGCEIVIRLKGRFWHDRNMVSQSRLVSAT